MYLAMYAQTKEASVFRHEQVGFFFFTLSFKITAENSLFHTESYHFKKTQ